MRSSGWGRDHPRRRGGEWACVRADDGRRPGCRGTVLVAAGVAYGLQATRRAGPQRRSPEPSDPRQPPSTATTVVGTRRQRSVDGRRARWTANQLRNRRRRPQSPVGTRARHPDGNESRWRTRRRSPPLALLPPLRTTRSRRTPMSSGVSPISSWPRIPIGVDEVQVRP